MLIEQEIDPEEARVALKQEEETLVKEVERGERMLSNPGFLSKAPKAKIDLETEKLASNKEKLAAVRDRLSKL